MNRLKYNSYDCLATHQIFAAIYSPLNGETRRVYEAEMGLQGVCLGVQMRGILVDQFARQDLLIKLEVEANNLQGQLEHQVGRNINPRSPKQLAITFYDELHLTKQLDKKSGSTTTGEDALKKIEKKTVSVTGQFSNAEKSEFKQKGSEIAAIILKYRDLEKQIEMLHTKQYNGRLRTNLNVGGTESYRLSASKSHAGDGLNHQNQDKRLRVIYIPDPDFTMVQMDQERAESLTVAYCSGDENYINAHLRENTHVYVARILWPKIAWNGNDGDKSLAKKLQPDGKEAGLSGRESMYDKAKMVQHGLNYLLTPIGLAHHSGLTVADSEAAYRAYFTAFPKIPIWHEEVIKQVRETGVLHYPGGYQRVFFGRRYERSTHREAISSIPQSIVAWTNHVVFKRLYYELDGPDFQVLSHIHDAVLFQVRRNKWAEYKPRVIQLSKVDWPIKERIMTIPFEIKAGRNWKEVS